MEPITYYFIVGSRQFLINEEPLEEVLRERIQYYSRTKKRIDFWLVPEATFLNTMSLKEKLPKNVLAIVSTNKIFITWLKLRLNNVLLGKFLAPTQEIKCPLSYAIF
jgi:hypothetical protein